MDLAEFCPERIVTGRRQPAHVEFLPGVLGKRREHHPGLAIFLLRRIVVVARRLEQKGPFQVGVPRRVLDDDADVGVGRIGDVHD